MQTTKMWRWSSLVVVLAMLLSTFTAVSAQPDPIEQDRLPVAESVEPTPQTQETVSFFDSEDVFVRVVVSGDVDLSKYGQFVAAQVPDPSGGRIYYGLVAESALDGLRQIAGVGDVARIQVQAEAPDGRPDDPDVETRALPDTDELRERLIALRDNPPEPIERVEPTGWWDVAAGGHNAVEAWEAGYTGAGVAVAVNDSGVDMAHPDFWGTEHRYENFSSDPYYDYFEGWPVALSPFANYLMAFDLELNGQLTSGNTFHHGASAFANTSATGTGSAITFGGQTYTTSGTASPLNPVYHIGYHPDWSLWAVWGNRIAVLVVDENGDGLYDTVYVDLNNNFDFRDDKPARKDMYWDDNYVQGADELSWWDADLDGYPDLSGGMLYFISDGYHCPPFFDVYFGCATSYAGGYFPPPGNGSLVAFQFVNLYDTDHGQLCASNVVGQGNIDGYAPAVKPDGMGGVIQGAGLDAELVPVGDIYYGFEQSVEQAWWFQALGYDGWATMSDGSGDDDSIQASSNSFGPWRVYEDGWDEWSRISTYINYFINPFTTYFMSSGNTGPGYGTTGAPQPITAIQVTSSSQYDSGGVYEPMASLEQMTVGDTASYASRGPSANNQLVPHVAANGAWGTGALGLNEWGDGWSAWDIWGGTSRSSPVAMGTASLAIGAYMDNHGRWPAWDEVRQFMMQGANHIYYDPMTSGTGYINAARSAFLAGGDYGVLAAFDHAGSIDYWDVGEFNGMRYDGGFAHIAEPDAVYTTTLELWDVSGSESYVVSDYTLMQTGEYTYTFTTADVSMEDGAFLKPDYLFSIEELIGGPIPAGTVFLQAEIMYAHADFDYDGSYTADSIFRLNPYDWTDIDNDGELWVDLNSDGVVNWDEIDAMEYVRINRAYDDNHYQLTPIGDPINRVHDGLYVGIRHNRRTPSVPTTELSVRVTLYAMADWDALDTSEFSGHLSGENSGVVTFTAPSEYGLYQGFILVDVEDAIIRDAYGEPYSMVIPVYANVAYQGDLMTDDPIVFGDNSDADEVYANGYVRPIADWAQGRATGGDWRFFYFNQMGDPSAAGHQTKLVTRTSWDGEEPADIDTYILSPDPYFSSISNDPSPPFLSSYGMPDDFWGPYSLAITGRSESPFLSNGTWAFDTVTGENVDYAIGDLGAGLHGLQIHSMLYDGDDFREDYMIEVGYIDAPSFLEWDNYDSVSVEVTTNMTFTEDITVTAFGLSPVDLFTEVDQFAPGPSTGEYDACFASYHYEFTASDLAQLTVIIDNFVDGDDLDLWLLYDFNGNGTYECGSEVIGADGSGDPDPEMIVVDNPPDGTYWVAVEPYNIGADTGETFDLFITGLELGDTIQVANVDAGDFGPGAPLTFDVFNKVGTCDHETRTCLDGVVQIWMEGDGLTALFDIPVHPRYSRVDLTQSSVKWAEELLVLPGDLLTYTIQVVNTDVATGTVIVTDVLPLGTTLYTATAGFTEVTTGVLEWEIDVPSGGGRIVTTDYNWVDISGIGTPNFDWFGLWTLYYGVEDDDEGAVTVTLPFSYTFFGDDYDTLHVTANGEATFDFSSSIGSGFYSDGLIPGLDEYFLRFAVLPGDQAGPLLPSWYGLGTTLANAANGGVVYTYYDDGSLSGEESFIIQWDEWMFSWRPCYYYGAGCDIPYPDNTYQLILYPDGRAVAQYAEINELPVVLNLGGPGDVGVEGWEDWNWYLGEGYTWHMTPESGSAWMYDPSPTDMVELTVVVEVDDPLDDWTDLCNMAYLDDGYEVTLVGDCAYAMNADTWMNKTVDTPMYPVAGDTVTYTVYIGNDGPLSTTFMLTDTLDEGLVFDGIVSYDGLGTFSSDGYVITGTGWLTAGEDYELVYTAIITSEVLNDYLCNDAVLENDFGGEYWDYACFGANETSLSVSKTYYADYRTIGALVTYTVSVENTGALPTDIDISDALPAGLTFVEIVAPAEAGYITATRTITAAFENVAPDAIVDLVFVTTIDAGLTHGASICNTAEAVGDDSADDARVCFTVQNPFYLSDKDGPLAAYVGESFIYEIFVANADTITHTAIVTDMLPVEVIVDEVALAGDMTYLTATHEVVWEGDVPPGGLVLEIPVMVDWVMPGYIFNEAVIDGSGMLKTVYHMTEIWPALYLDKSIGTGMGDTYEAYIPWGEDNIFHYHLDIYNDSYITAPVHIEDWLPVGVIVDETSLMPGMSYDEDLHLFEWDGIVPPFDGVRVEFHVYGTLEAAQEDKALFNSFYVTDDWGFEYESNMTQAHIVSTELEVLKWADVETAAIGDEIHYTVLIRNVGDDFVSPMEATLVDELPPDVTLIEDSVEITEAGISSNCLQVGQNLVCDFIVTFFPETNEFRLHYAVTVDDTASLGDLLINTVSVNDSYGATTYGACAVEVVAGNYIYLPLVVRN